MTSIMKEAMKKAGMKLPNDSNPKAQPERLQEQVEEKTEDLQDYTAKAEKVILDLKNNRYYEKFTTSKLRNILSMVSEIYNDVLSDYSETLSPKIQDRILHMKVRLVYECGREPIIKEFYKLAELEKIINGIGDSRKRFNYFAKYMEALVAYHSFYGGSNE
jgi:CRISPR-associated protein Csm2